MPTRREVTGSIVMAAAGSTAAPGISFAAAPDQPRLEFAFEANVSVDKPLVVGDSAHGLRRIVPITGGTVSGPRFAGRVIPGGADWQYVRPDGVLSVEAKYTLESQDGVLVMVTNRGLRHGPPEVIAKLGRGESVDPSEYYFRTTAEFEAPAGSRYDWLNRSVFVGIAQRQANAAIIRFWQLL